MKYPFQQLQKTHAAYLDELKRAAAEVIESGWYLRGSQTAAFEKELSAALGVSDSVATGNGLDALRLILRGYMELGRLKEGDELIAAANTYIATILPASELGLKVRLIDPDEQTMCLNLADAARNANDRTRVVAVTHLYGNPSWDEEAAAALRQNGVIIMEDNAQAIGAAWHGHKTGSLGDASAQSFYPSKNIGALGDAGAVCSSDSQLIAAVRSLHNYGSDRQYHFKYRGYNSRMDEMQAALLRIKLRHLGEVTALRNRAAAVYNASISHPDIQTPAMLHGCTQAWHQYILRSHRRDELAEYLRSNGVGTMIHYPIPPHRQPCYEGMLDGSYPLTDRLAAEVLSIPIADIDEREASEISDIINSFPKN